jgi:N-methylhydantoinase A
VLGRINADRPIGGKLRRLDVDAARAAIARHVGEPLGLDPLTAAEAVVRVANAKMAGAIRLVSIERGHDPGRFAAVPFGGGGALHAGALIKDVGLKAALVPRFPGVTSALGCVIADIRHDQVRTVNLMLDGLDAAALDRRMMDEAAAARQVVEAAGLSVERIDILFELDMHYLGQTHTVSVPVPVVPDAGSTGVSEPIVRAAFERAYQTSFSRLLPGVPVKIVNLRTAAVGRRPHFDLKALAPGGGASRERASLGSRTVWFDGGWHDTPIYARLDLPVGAEIHGPAILEQPDATTVVDPDLVARVDQLGNVIVARAGA